MAKANVDLRRPLFRQPFEDQILADGYDFNVNEVLGHGGSGAVLAASKKEEMGGRTVMKQLAVKFMDVERSGSRDDLKQKWVYREKHALNHLAHPNVVRVYHIYIEAEAATGRSPQKDCKILIFMERCEMSLRGVMRQLGKPPKEKLVKVWIAHCTDALEYMRKQNICHRDIKVDNMMLDSKNNVCKLADFGLARIVDKQRGRDGTPQVVLVRSFGGTAYTTAPEMLKRQPYNPFFSDMWALGVSFFELLNWTPPFDATNARKFMPSMYDRDKYPLPWRKVKMGMGAKRASPEAQAIILQMLQPEPEKRITYEQLRANAYFHPVPPLPWEGRPPPGQTVFLRGQEEALVRPPRKSSKSSATSTQSGLLVDAPPPPTGPKQGTVYGTGETEYPDMAHVDYHPTTFGGRQPTVDYASISHAPPIPARPRTPSDAPPPIPARPRTPSDVPPPIPEPEAPRPRSPEEDEYQRDEHGRIKKDRTGRPLKVKKKNKPRYEYQEEQGGGPGAMGQWPPPSGGGGAYGGETEYDDFAQVEYPEVSRYPGETPRRPGRRK